MLIINHFRLNRNLERKIANNAASRDQHMQYVSNHVLYTFRGRTGKARANNYM